MMIYLLIILQSIIAFFAMDFQGYSGRNLIVVICFVGATILSIIIARKKKKESEEIKENQLEILHITKETNETVKTIVRKSPKIYPDDKGEAEITIGLEGIIRIIDGYNITTITDEGCGKITIGFEDDFKDRFYDVRITGSTGEIQHKIVARTEGSLSIEFDEEGLEWIRIVCWER